jgi:hypothetical protein
MLIEKRNDLMSSIAVDSTIEMNACVTSNSQVMFKSNASIFLVTPLSEFELYK